MNFDKFREVISTRQGTVFSVLLAALLVACKPTPPLLPITGQVRLEFVRISGSAIHFRLKNQSSRIISLRGNYIEAGRVNPWNAWMECSQGAPDGWTDGPYALIDGMAETVEVGAGAQLDLITGLELHQRFIDGYKSGRCKLNLILMDKTIIESDEFRP